MLDGFADDAVDRVGIALAEPVADPVVVRDRTRQVLVEVVNGLVVDQVGVQRLNRARLPRYG